MICIDLTEKETAYLVAAVLEFYHRMRAAEGNALVPDIENRSATALSLWRKVENQAQLDL